MVEILKKTFKIANPKTTSSAGGNLESYTKEQIDSKFGESTNKITDTVKKLEKMDIILFSVVIVLLVMVATLVIDSFHINSTSYNEYAEKLDLTNQNQEMTKLLIEQNKSNQQIIIEQQKQILLKLR